MIPRPTPPLLRNRHINPLPQDRARPRQQRQIRHPFLHDDRPDVRLPDRITRLPHHLARDAVPAVGLLEREVALQLQVEGVELAQLGELGFLGDAAGHVQLRRLRVEVRLRHPDRERRVDARRRGRARGGFRGDAAERRGPEEVVWAD